MKNKRQIIFRAVALAIVLAVAAAMFVIGRGHTIYFDNKTCEYNGQSVEAFYKVNVTVGGEKVAKLSARDRGMTDIMGQSVTMTLEITDQKGGTPHAHKVTLGVPYNMDGIILNLPALMAGLPEDAYMSEFVITAPVQDEAEEEVNTDEFDMGDQMGSPMEDQMGDQMEDQTGDI